jgi:hypothetical protein
MRMAAAAGLAACVGILAGCGNTYRPVVATIGLVGPAGQPQKYAIAVSSPSPTSNGLMTMVDFSGDTVLVTATVGVNPYYLVLNSSGTTGYTLNSDGTLNSFDINTSLISSQVLRSTLLPTSNPVSLFATTASTFVSDPGVNAVDQLVGAPPALKQELPVAAGFSPLYMVGQSGAVRAYAISPSTSGGPGQVTAIENPSSLTSSPTISTTLPVGRGPVYGVMTLDDRRAFILNQTDGTVTVINAQTNALDQFQDSFHTFQITGFSVAGNVVTFQAANSLQPGMSVNIAGLSKGLFLNNQTLTVLSAGLSSSQFEASFSNSNVAFTSDSGTAAELTSTVPVGTRPVWADLAAGLNELLVANEGDGVSTPGSVSIIEIPLCSASALQQNPNCDPNNPIDGTAFGQVVATVPVGINPIMVSVLSDYTRAYVANAGNPNLPCAANGIAVAGKSTTCTVSVVNLTSNTVTATIPINGGSPLGHPAYIATSAGTPTGKVYVVCKDTQVMTVIETDTDSVDTTVPLQGNGVSVRMTQP